MMHCAGEFRIIEPGEKRQASRKIAR
jgi:hypothetical protein